MVNVSVDEVLRARCPSFCLGLLWGRVANTPHNEILWEELNREIEQVRGAVELARIQDHPAIAATREAYRRCGKKPTRYRPSAEALRRRIVKGQGLQGVNTVVDAVNLVSLRSGFCIGGFDADTVDSDLTWGIGAPDEPFEAIGRGALNITGMPVVRDTRGAIGTPSSDSMRTRITLETRHVLLLVNAYGGPRNVTETTQLARDLLERHASGTETVTKIVG